MKDSTYIFYCIIGRMKYYEGNCNADSIEGGGSHPSKDKHEIFNFKDISGKTYGFVQPRGRIIHIERIGGEDFKYEDKIDDVLVIWVSPTGIGNGREIVGWYNHATVYREVQSGRHQKQRAYKNYNIVANTADCQLIPLEMRSFEVPQQKGYSGQANIWYADSHEGIAFSKKVRSYIKTLDFSPATDQDIVDIIVEGGKRVVKTNIYERDEKGRKHCIATKGTRCSICGMSFEEIYGEIGKGFIHVHHIIPVSTMGKSREYDAKDLLIPVCPNCHAMLHKKAGGMPYTPEELKLIMQNVKKRNIDSYHDTLSL